MTEKNWRAERGSDADKAERFVNNHVKNGITWDQMSEMVKVPKRTLIGLKQNPQRFKTGKWEVISNLAKMADKRYESRILGDRPNLSIQAIKTIVKQKLPGDKPVDKAMRKILITDPLALAEIAKALESERDDE